MIQWLRTSFQLKEQRLRDFYCDANRSSWPQLLRYSSPDTTKALFRTGSWSFAVCIGLVLFPWFRWVCCMYIVACVLAKFGDGFDRMELALHGDMLLGNDR